MTECKPYCDTSIETPKLHEAFSPEQVPSPRYLTKKWKGTMTRKDFDPDLEKKDLHAFMRSELESSPVPTEPLTDASFLQTSPEDVFVVNVYIKLANGTEVAHRKPIPYHPASDNDIDLSNGIEYIFATVDGANYFALQVIHSIYSGRLGGKVKLKRVLKAARKRAVGGSCVDFVVAVEEA